MVTQRSRRKPASQPPKNTAEEAPASAPKHLDQLMAASVDGLTVVGAALHRQSSCGTTFWVSCGNIFDLARDAVSGELLLRVGAEVWTPCALELATMGGMLLAASMLQSFIEDKGNDGE